jgi:hypothetical protein
VEIENNESATEIVEKADLGFTSDPTPELECYKLVPVGDAIRDSGADR